MLMSRFFQTMIFSVLPGALELMMRVYERDATMAIGGVCSASEANPPTTTIQTANRECRTRPSDRVPQIVRAVLHRFEEPVPLGPLYYRDPPAVCTSTLRCHGCLTKTQLRRIG